MFSTLQVVKACTVRLAYHFPRTFVQGEIVNYGSLYYDPLRWSGLATETGIESPETNPEPPPEVVQVMIDPVQDKYHIEWNEAAGNWEVADQYTVIQGMITDAIDNLVSGAPEAMNTLNELSQRLQANDNADVILTNLVNTKANIASPTFTGTVGGITKTMVGLANVDNTSDANKPVSTAGQTALNLKANLASPAFTGSPTVTGSAIEVVGNKSNVTTLGTSATLYPTQNAVKAYVDAAIASLINGAPGTMDTLKEISDALAADDSVMTGLQNQINTKEPILTQGTSVQYYRGDKTWAALDKVAVGLANVDNTSDVNKPVSTAQSNSMDDHITNLRSSVLLNGGGTVSFIGGNFDWTQRFIIIGNGYGARFGTTGFFNIDRPTAGAIITGVGGKTNVTVVAGGIPLGGFEVLYYILPIGSGSASVAANFRIAAHTAALDVPDTWVPIAGHNNDNGQLKVQNGINLTAGLSWTAANPKTSIGLANVDNTSDAAKPVSTAQATALSGKADSSHNHTSMSQIGTGAVGGSNTYLKADGTWQTPTINGVAPPGGGTVNDYLRGDTTWQPYNKTTIGLSNVDNTSDAAKPISTATQTQLDLKAPLASPAFTGTPTGITKTHVGLANVDNVADANKPVSTAQSAAISAASTTDRDRANHTGSQAISTVTGLQAALDLKIEPHTFAVTGALTVASGKSRVYFEGGYTVVSVRASVNTAPTGASIICDVNKNGTTIYTTQANRPTITAAGFTATANSPDVTTFVSGDYITVDIDQIGSTVSGSDLTVTIRLRRTS